MRIILVGTRKGLFIIRDGDVEEPHHKGWQIFHAISDPRDGALYTASNNFVYGGTARSIARPTVAAISAAGAFRSEDADRSRASSSSQMAICGGSSAFTSTGATREPASAPRSPQDADVRVVAAAAGGTTP